MSRFLVDDPTCPAGDTFDWGRLEALAGGRRVLLSFSCGKDSLASWLALLERGFEVVPYYLHLVPGLEFVEHSLRFYEKFFATRIYRCLHPNFYRRLHNDWYQPPGRVGVVENMRLPLFDYDDVADGVRETAGMPDAWQAVATRKSESIMRRHRMKADGLNRSRKTFTPIMDWRKDDVYRIMVRHKCPLPIDYQLFGRSFDGLYARYLAPIKERFPRDYRTILFYFPMADVELARYQMGVRHAKI